MEGKRYFKLISMISIVCVYAVGMGSCDSISPEVTKVHTVEEYNAIMETSDEILNNWGYYSNNSLASPGYKYVLYDSHVGCNIAGASGYGFRTGKDSRFDEINTYDICIACGEAWSDHRKR